MPMAGFEQCGDVGRHLCLVFLSGPNLLCLTVKACIQHISSIFKKPCFVEYSSYSWLPRPVSGDFMHAETGGIAGALIPPASYSGSGLGRTDLGRLGQNGEDVMAGKVRFSPPRSQLFRRIRVNDSVHMQSFLGCFEHWHHSNLAC